MESQESPTQIQLEATEIQASASNTENNQENGHESAQVSSRPRRKAAARNPYILDEPDSPPSPKPASKKAGASNRWIRRSKARQFDLDEASYVSTAVPVNLIPDIFNDVLDILSKSDKNICYDKYAIQSLLITAVLDDNRFSNSVSAREDILAYVLDSVREDKQKRFNLTSRRRNGRFDSDWRDPVVDEDIIKRYHELMESQVEKQKRSYRNEERKGYAWTRQDLERFKTAFQRYGYSPVANRKIAEFIGPHIHPNHVGYFKQRLRRQHEKKKVEEIVESEAWTVMVQNAPEHSEANNGGVESVNVPNPIAGDNTEISQTTPALATLPPAPKRENAGSRFPKKKKKRKPPPPPTKALREERVLARQKAAEERASAAATETATASAALPPSQSSNNMNGQDWNSNSHSIIDADADDAAAGVPADEIVDIEDFSEPLGESVPAPAPAPAPPAPIHETQVHEAMNRSNSAQPGPSTELPSKDLGLDEIENFDWDGPDPSSLSAIMSIYTDSTTAPEPQAPVAPATLAPPATLTYDDAPVPTRAHTPPPPPLPAPTSQPASRESSPPSKAAPAVQKTARRTPKKAAADSSSPSSSMMMEFDMQLQPASANAAGGSTDLSAKAEEATRLMLDPQHMFGVMHFNVPAPSTQPVPATAVAATPASTPKEKAKKRKNFDPSPIGNQLPSLVEMNAPPAKRPATAMVELPVALGDYVLPATMTAPSPLMMQRAPSPVPLAPPRAPSPAPVLPAIPISSYISPHTITYDHPPHHQIPAPFAPVGPSPLYGALPGGPFDYSQQPSFAPSLMQQNPRQSPPMMLPFTTPITQQQQQQPQHHQPPPPHPHQPIYNPYNPNYQSYMQQPQPQQEQRHPLGPSDSVLPFF